MRFTVAAVLLAGLFAGKTTWDGVYSEAQAKRGEALYTQKCAGCHGPELTGGDEAPSLTGPDFNAGWNDLPAADLAERIRTTMPADAAGSLGAQETADLIAFIFAKAGFPAAETDLPAAPEQLKEIKIVTQKP